MLILWRSRERHSTTKENRIRIGRERGERGRGGLGKEPPLSSAAATFSSFV